MCMGGQFSTHIKEETVVGRPGPNGGVALSTSIMNLILRGLSSMSMWAATEGFWGERYG